MKKLTEKLEQEMKESVTGTEMFYAEMKFFELIEKGRWSRDETQKMIEKKDLLPGLALDYLESEKRNMLLNEVLTEEIRQST